MFFAARGRIHQLMMNSGTARDALALSQLAQVQGGIALYKALGVGGSGIS